MSSSRHRASEKPEVGTDCLYVCRVSIFAAIPCGQVANNARTAPLAPSASSSSVKIIIVVVVRTMGVLGGSRSPRPRAPLKPKVGPDYLYVCRLSITAACGMRVNVGSRLGNKLP